MALLMSWLHPDKHPTGDRSIFAARVTGAWDSLRSAEKRAGYDATRAAAQAAAGRRRTSAHRRSDGRGGSDRPSWGYRGLPHGPDARPLPLIEHEGLLQRSLALLRRLFGHRSIP
jgi:hypothetical protein